MSRSRLAALTAFDRSFDRQGETLLAGVDEAGRGPLAGPVVAAAVVFIRPVKGRTVLSDLNDSKQLTASARERLFHEIVRVASVSVARVGEDEIDRMNIYQATRLAMKDAVLGLTRTPDHLLIDGIMKLDLPVLQTPVIGGDGKSASIAAASIIAKVCRDAWMHRLDQLYPDYNFKQHKGYGTPQHLQKIVEFGPCPVHRKTFFPVQNFFQTSETQVSSSYPD